MYEKAEIRNIIICRYCDFKIYKRDKRYKKINVYNDKRYKFKEN